MKNRNTQPNEATAPLQSRFNSLIHRARMRRYVLDVAAQRHHSFTRVSDEFYKAADAHLRAWVRDYIQRLPSNGKTIR
jgi:hypothetical protein